jgi:hypothetical protein
VAIDLPAAQQFIWRTARVLDRHRLALFLGDSGPDEVRTALAAYRDRGGGYGHGLEPDQRTPTAQPTPTLYALEVLHEAGATAADPDVVAALDWLGSIANPDGSVPFAIAGTYEDAPHAPWFADAATTFLTPGIVGAALDLGAHDHPWVVRATECSWATAEAGSVGGYALRHVVAFLDRADDDDRARAALAALGPLGSAPVEGGQEAETLDVLDVSPRPGRSRASVDDGTVEAALDALEAGQQDDGGWTFGWPAWTPAQEVESRGTVTLQALHTLRANGRL